MCHGGTAPLIETADEDVEARIAIWKRWQLNECLTRLESLPLLMTEEVVSLGELQEMVAGIAMEAPLSLVIVDYLQLVRAPNEIRERRHQVEAISQGLKTLALQYHVPVLWLSSLSRPTTDGKDKPPTLTSLRESGELEHDADIILLLHRRDHDEETCPYQKHRTACGD